MHLGDNSYVYKQNQLLLTFIYDESKHLYEKQFLSHVISLESKQLLKRNAAVSSLTVQQSYIFSSV